MYNELYVEGCGSIKVAAIDCSANLQKKNVYSKEFAIIIQCFKYCET